MEFVVVLVVLAVVAFVALRVAVTRRADDRAAPAEPTDETGDGRQAGTATAPPDADVDTPPEDVEEAAPADAELVEEATEPPLTGEAPPAEAPVEAPPEPPSLRERFRERLQRTRNALGVSVAELFGRGVSDEAWEGLEEALIAADVGVEATLQIVEELRRRSREQGATDAPQILELLKDELRSALAADGRSLSRRSGEDPTVWLVTGVNGTGKTTSIGKLAAIEQREGRSVVLAAADTFRAAAADQLGLWAERTDARLVRKDEGADPASVAYDGYMAARATDADLLMIDTAGRLHNKRELMDELGKVKRVVEKQAGPLDEVLLVIDATTGQNGIAQARAFMEAVEITGIVLTKLDGSSKGGIVVAVQRELGIPVKLVGIGEGVDDLAPFDADDFVEGLFGDLQLA